MIGAGSLLWAEFTEAGVPQLDFVCLPLASLDKLALQKEIDRIGRQIDARPPPETPTGRSLTRAYFHFCLYS
jgi:hypothetical protein